MYSSPVQCDILDVACLFTNYFCVYVQFSFVHSESWEVSPVSGTAIEDHPRLILHLNSASLSLALMSPPRHFVRWPLSSLLQYDCLDCTFSFTIGGDNKPGEYEYSRCIARYRQTMKVCQLTDRWPPQFLCMSVSRLAWTAFL